MFTKWRRFLVPFLVVGFACTFYRHSTLNEFFQSGSKGGYWYLWVLAVFYLLLSLFRFTDKGKKGLFYDICLFTIIYVSFMGIIKVLKIPSTNDIFSVGRCLEMWPYFMLGYFTRKYSLLEYLRKYPAIVTIALVAYIGAFVMIEYLGNDFGRYHKLAGVTMIPVLVYLFSSHEHSNTKIENQKNQ